MQVGSISARLLIGQTILERLGKMSPPGELQPYIDAFRGEQARYEKGCEEVEAAEEKRDEAMAAIGKADGLLDMAVGRLAVMVMAAGKGDRKNPLARYTSYTMSRLMALAYAKEADVVGEIAEKISKDEPTEQLSAAVQECLQKSAQVKTALSELSGPEADYQRKLAARDAMVADWERAFGRLEVRAAAAWESEPEAVKVLFAKPQRVQQPVTRREKKNDKGAPSDPEPTPA